jgi:hypothetical protein
MGMTPRRSGLVTVKKVLKRSRALMIGEVGVPV